MQAARNVPDPLSATFFALADPTRRALLARLVEGEASVQELSAPFAMSQPAISKHLKVLERAGLVSSQADAQRRPRRIEAAPLAEVVGWLERYRQLWERNYQQLDALLAEMQSVTPSPRTPKPRRTPRRPRSVIRKRRSS